MISLSRIKHIFLASMFASFLFVVNLTAFDLDSLSIGDNENIRVDSITVTGNSTTKDFIILRELTFAKGDSVSGKTLRYNKERVFSLGLFTRVEFILHNETQSNVLEIRVSESWYIYPLPLFYSENGDLKKATYGISLLYRNFRGRNETVSTSLGFGYDPFYSIEYENPALSYEHDIGIKFLFTYVHPTNRSQAAKSIVGYDYQSKVFSQAISVSKRFNQYNLLSGLIGYDYIEAPVAYPGITASGQKVDRSPFLGVTYTFDSRDLKQYSRDGLYAFGQFVHKGFGLGSISYNRFILDYREYRTIVDKLAAKWRLAWNTSFGRVVPYYDYSYLGYYERVRGHSGDIREGKSYLLTSLEFSYPLLTEWNLSFKLPVIPQSLTTYRIEIYLTTFYDAGETYNWDREIALQNFYSGYGWGLTFLILPYNAVRLEYARNELGKGEFLFGIGFSF